MPHEQLINEAFSYNQGLKAFMCCLHDCRLGKAEIEYMCRKLKHSKVELLLLRNNNINVKEIKYLVDTLQYTKIYYFTLTKNRVGFEGAKYIAEGLKGTHLSELNLDGAHIGDEGVNCLIQALKFTKITCLNLNDNNITDQGFKLLADGLMDDRRLPNDFSIILDKNLTTTDTAQRLCHLLLNKTTIYLSIQIKFKDTDGYLKFNRCGLKNRNSFYLEEGKLGNDGVTFINMSILKTLKCVVDELSFGDDWEYSDDDVEHVFKAFKGVHVELIDCSDFLKQSEYLTKIMRGVKVIALGLGAGFSGDDVILLALSALQNFSILEVYLQSHNVTDKGAKYLADILKNTQLTVIDLSYNSIGKEGASCLARGLQGSQVVEVRLGCRGDDLNNTIYSCAETLELNKINRIKLSSEADQLCNTFQSIISRNSTSGGFEFNIPKGGSIDINPYVFLIGTLSRNKNIKAQLFNLSCRVDGDYNGIVVNQLDNFLELLPQKFNEFFNEIVANLLPNETDFIDILKQFDAINQSEIVQNLLLHRQLYYVDEDQEIMHPFAYEMLHKHNMTLIEESLEPNKKDEIVCYYQNHMEVEGAQNVIALLATLHL